MHKYLVLCLFLTGCVSKGITATIFLKETNSVFYNLHGETCKESGLELIEERDKQHYDLITFFSNCGFHQERQLDEVELKQWKGPPNAAKATQIP